MKILIDENLPIKLKDKLIDYEVFTVRDMNWNSVKNGKLLKLAVENCFNIFITTDKNLQFQQNISKIGLALIVMNVRLLKWSMVEPLIPKLLQLLPNTEINAVYTIE